jgi:hypothetical protein
MTHNSDSKDKELDEDEDYEEPMELDTDDV